MTSLKEKKCIPCSGEVPPLDLSEKNRLMKEIDSNWELRNEKKRLFRSFKFEDYKKPWEFVSKISELAEEEWHHPDLKFGWGYLEVEIWTHKIDSLVESDFIFAAKVDQIFSSL